MSEADAGGGECGYDNRLHLRPLGGRDGSGGAFRLMGMGMDLNPS